MDKVEKVARAIPDEAVEAALVAWYAEHGRLRIEWPDGIPSPHRASRANGMRAAIQAALAVMEREGEALSGHGDYTPVTIRSGTVASPRPEAVGEAVKAERERCAKAAEQTRQEAEAMFATERDGYQQAYFQGQIFAAEEIATAIRARGET